MLEKLFRLSSPPGTLNFWDVVKVLLQVGISSGAIYAVLEAISTYGQEHLSVNAATVVAAVVVGVKAGLQAYFNGPTPTPAPDSKP